MLHRYTATVRTKPDIGKVIRELNALENDWEPESSLQERDDSGTYWDYTFTSRDLTPTQEKTLSRKPYIIVFSKDGEEYLD